MIKFLKDFMELVGMEHIPSFILLIFLILSGVVAIIKFFDFQDQIRKWIIGAGQKRKRVSATDYSSDSVQHSIAKEIEKRKQFKDLTGINIHPDRIKVLVELRNRSNGEFDWPQIKAAKNFIKFTDEGYIISLTKCDRLQDIMTVIVFSVPILMFILLFCLTVYSIFFYKEPDSFRGLIQLIFCLIMIVGSLVFMQYIRSAYLSAKFIKKNFKEIH